MEPLEQLTYGVLAFKEQNELLEKEAQELRERLEGFEKRARAEEVLTSAMRAATVPAGLRPCTIEDFLAKRAELEQASENHIDKVAMFVQYCEDEEGIMLSDEDDSPGLGVFNEWLESIV